VRSAISISRRKRRFRSVDENGDFDQSVSPRSIGSVRRRPSFVHTWGRFFKTYCLFFVSFFPRKFFLLPLLPLDTGTWKVPFPRKLITLGTICTSGVKFCAQKRVSRKRDRKKISPQLGSIFLIRDYFPQIIIFPTKMTWGLTR
jgi:hypothetical protein